MDIHQISVFLENQAGKLSEVTNLLADNDIDLRAINIAESSDYGIMRVITSDSEKALAILREHGFIVNSTAVLAQEKFDVEYMYSIFGQPNGLAYMILRVDDIDEVRNVLEQDGIHTADCTELGINS